MARILVADDNPDVLELLKTILLADGHDVMLAQNGKQALMMHQESPADLVITDIIMPDSGGIDLMRNLRRCSPGTRIIALSGGGNFLKSKEYLRIAKLVGVDRAFEKPFMPTDLREAVNELLPKETEV